MASNTSTFLTGVGTPVASGLTALASDQVAGLQLTAITNLITVSASDTDKAQLPADRPQGSMMFVFNHDAAQDVKVYPNTGGTINGASANTPLTVGQQQGVIFVQTGTTGLTWAALLGAVATPA